MPDGLVINTSVDQTVRALCRSLLESGRVKGVLALGRTGETEEGVAYSLFTASDAFRADGVAQPLLPFMPANAGGLLSRLTLKGPLSEPVMAVVKPCEIRAFIELVKLRQGSLDNIVLISSTCGGVYPIEAGFNGDLKDKLPRYWEEVKTGELVDGVRPNCRACTQFMPENADITIALLGEADLDTQCTLFLNTEKGHSFVNGLESLEGTILPINLETELIQHIQDRREDCREELFADVEVGRAGLIHTFGRCINCHACMMVCPICYCHLCYFDAQECERPIDFYESEMGRKGATRVPADTLFFQLGRLAHMSISCVGCGMCSDVCPADIPIATIFSKVGASVQVLFNYHPGKCVTEEIPLKTFEVDEFTRIGQSEAK
jgi:formate dehydrogenase subunit beta